MRKFFAGILATLSAVLMAGAISYGVTLTYITAATPGCGDGSQLINCVNTTVYGVLNGVGQTKNISVGLYGTATGATPVTLNTQGGVVSFTGVAITLDTTTSVVVNDTFITAASACVANIGNSAGTAYVGSVVPAAGTLTLGLGAPATLASQTVAVNFWCFN